jgi:hypothetical protein
METDLQSKNVYLCLTNRELRHEDVWGNECIDPRIPYLRSSWRQVASFMLRPLYNPRKIAPVSP